jgi:GNAT superfamily N-acetyltransferase
MNLSDDCLFSLFNAETLNEINDFDCGDNDLNDFFRNDALNYSNELLGKTYCFRTNKTPKRIICCFTVANDAVYLRLLPNNSKKRVRKNIPYVKHNMKYPAVLIGRIGVAKAYQKHKIGSQLLDFIKFWFFSKENKTGCRFITVDAYKPVADFYEKNGFSFLYKSEEDEKKQYEITDKKPLQTRIMFFDLGILRSN